MWLLLSLISNGKLGLPDSNDINISEDCLFKWDGELRTKGFSKDTELDIELLQWIVEGDSKKSKDSSGPMGIEIETLDNSSLALLLSAETFSKGSRGDVGQERSHFSKGLRLSKRSMKSMESILLIGSNGKSPLSYK